jgi:DNA-directed RNA polymerase specialized sigma24 family protein
MESVGEKFTADAELSADPPRTGIFSNSPDELVRSALEQMKPEEQQIIVLRFISDLSLDQMAEILVEESPADLYADSADHHDQQIHRRREAWEIIEVILAQQNEKERLIITLMELEEKTVKETAALTGWSESNVKVRAHRARNKMREIFQSQTDHASS